MKVCLVGSSGGHLTHLYMLKPFWKDKERFWVTFDKEDARSLLEGEKVYPCYYPTNRSLKALVKNTKIAWDVLHKEKPDLIVSCGAAVAVPFFYIGKMMGAKVVYIEVFDRIALILLAIVALKNRRNILMWGLLIASVFIQRASLIYAIFPIFYFYYKKNKMTMKKATAFIIIGCAVGYIGKKVIIGGSIGYLTGGVYANYASASSSAGYLFDYIKLIVEQVIIDGYMILSYKKVNGQLQEMEELEKEKLRMLQMMCYFDLMLIPICYILGIWRGASYFFLPRLLILGYIITDFSRKISKNSRKAYYMIVKVAMPIWLVLRLFTVYDVSGLMPYYLDFRL